MLVSGTRLFVSSLFFLFVTNPVWADPGPKPQSVQPNDNRRSAGTLLEGTLTLKLRAAVGLWSPEGETGPALRVEAFGEESGPLTAPSPLIRVPEGTEIVASVRNDLDAPLRIHGLCARDGEPCAPIDVPPSLTRQLHFKAGRAGTYHYWATTTGMPIRFRAAADTQLSGAFIVDPPNVTPDADRVLVITDWTSVTRAELRELAAADDPGVAFLQLNPRFVFLINGLSWPATERLTYQLGETVRWRVINLSSQVHPLHLHGFHFEVDSLGDGSRDVPFDARSKPLVVTQVLQPGGTLAMTWVPERIGNWLFHCHIAAHVSPTTRLGGPPASHADHHGSHQSSAGMAGMVLGVTVTDPDGSQIDCYRGPSGIPTRKLTLEMRTGPGRYGAEPAYGFVQVEGNDERAAQGSVPVPGPTLVLHRGEPVEITLVNRLPEATAIHWHGMELESFYDGVHGWSGVGQRLTPLVEPGETFVVRFTPPRAGTFMYHTHLHDGRQLTSGLYGPMVVLESGETFDPSVDHVVVIGRGGPGADAPTLVNGERNPQFVWKAGSRHRVRLIHITPDDIFVVSLRTSDGPVSWRPLMKDAAAVPPHLSDPKLASQTIAVGETFDFEFEAPPGRRNLWLEIRSPAGKWFLQGHVIVKELSPSAPRTN